MPCTFSKRELAIGTKIEMEHTRSKKIAEKIAMDHLREFPTYYTDGLIPMERKLRRMKKKKVVRRKRAGFGRSY